MDSPDPLLDRQPVAVFVAGLVAVVDLGIAVATAFDWLALTNGQATALGAFVAGVGTLAATTLREQVWCRASVRAAGIDT
jgi:hypothetical protein